MNIETFKSLKNSPEALILNKSINELINMLSVGGRRTIKNFNRGGNQLLKNPKMQLLKDKIENKVNLCLNKLSEMNINNLLHEFIESMGRINLPEYLEIQKAFYVKMQADISFVKIYLEFFKIVSNVYKEVFNFEPEFFYSIIETKCLLDYSTKLNVQSLEENLGSTKLNVPDELLFLNDYEDETKRINNLTILRTILSNNMLNGSVQPIIDKLILEQTNYFADIYYWFQNEKLSSTVKDIIKSIILSNSLPLREKVLLDNLIDNKPKTKIDSVITTPLKSHEHKTIESPIVTSKTKHKNNDKIDTDTLKLETENILEEYLNMDTMDDMKEFIEERCKDALSKNKFCQYVFDKYFETSTETSVKILELMKTLVKKQILYKSNLSRGILLIYSNWNDVSLDYNKPNKKMKDLLQCLKNMGITKYLESLLKTYKIEFNEQQTINI
jgi:hypothetical protein